MIFFKKFNQNKYKIKGEKPTKEGHVSDMVSPRNPVGQFHCPSRYKRLFPSKNRKKILFTSLDS